MASALHPRQLSPAEVDELTQRVPEFAASLSGQPVPTPDWLADELAAARNRRQATEDSTDA